MVERTNPGLSVGPGEEKMGLKGSPIGGVFFVNAAVAGAILTESVFGWPGIGSYVVNSVYARDYPVIQGAILLIGCCVIAINGMVDLFYRAANPRMRGRNA